MLLTPGQQICGASARLLQLATLEIYEDFDAERLALELGCPASEATNLIERLVLEGWLELYKDKLDRYCGTQAWRQLRAARTGKPLPRERAEVLVAEMLECVKVSNRNPTEDCALITQVCIYGSYLDETRTELGDIDVAIEWIYPDAARHPNMTWAEVQKIPKIAANTVRAVKNRSAFISPSDMQSLLGLECEYEEVYSVLDDAELWEPSHPTFKAFAVNMAKLKAAGNSP